MIADTIEQDVVERTTFGKIFLRVVYDLISANRPNQIHIPCAAHAHDVCAECLCYLNSECTNAACCTVDQNFLSWLNLSSVAKSLQRGDSRDRHRCSLRERHGWGL